MNYINKRFPLINVSQLQLVAQYMQHCGIALTDVFDGQQLAFLHSSYEASGPVQISSEHLNQILRQLAQYLADPTLSLKIARMVKTENLGILGYLLHACSTLGASTTGSGCRLIMSSHCAATYNVLRHQLRHLAMEAHELA